MVLHYGELFEVLDSRVQRIYARIDQLPRFRYPIAYERLPQDGIYFFFEAGEIVEVDGDVRDRVARVGTHRVDGRFQSRIRQHFGRVRSLGGNKNSSVFRKHLGAALMRRIDDGDARLPGWLEQMGPSDRSIEEEVSELLRTRFTFCCIRVDAQEERLAFEAGLIALLAQHPIGHPSRGWLGRYAAAEGIRRSGLWNTQHLESTPFSEEQLARFEELVDSTIKGQPR